MAAAAAARSSFGAAFSREVAAQDERRRAPALPRERSAATAARLVRIIAFPAAHHAKAEVLIETICRRIVLVDLEKYGAGAEPG